ncbi:4'-phosphopantetheinyl transferase family protein [Kitasatospora sp. LaBMicrA B282]|uniref:4'-phosphopantetheinyl transferase family protein n=1 Tax=Kitasatospora sp. LaBMicrA B282 TaxID=3420949 RepID=UPI003D12E93C
MSPAQLSPRAVQWEQALGDLLPLRHALAGEGVGLGCVAMGAAGGGVGGGAGGADRPGAGPVGPAGPGEARAAAGMSPTRRQEFLAGRQAARHALRAAGGPDGDIGRAGRRPLAPPGWTLSITHSAGLAVALAAPLDRHPAVGCDLELRPLPVAAGRLVLTDPERAWVADAAPAGAERRLLALFSAKEAAFKLLCTLHPETFGPLTLSRITATRLPPTATTAHPLTLHLRPRLPGADTPTVRVHVWATGGGVFSWATPARA